MAIHYRVRLIGQVTGRVYVYSIPLPEGVPPIEARSRALSLHTNAFVDEEVDEQVYVTGASVTRAPRCWSLEIRRWRVVRCQMDRAHTHGQVYKYHCSPEGDTWLNW